MPDDEVTQYFLGLSKAQISNKLNTDKATESHKDSTKVYKEESEEVDQLTRRLTRFEKAAMKVNNVSRRMKRSITTGQAYGKKLGSYDYDDPNNRFHRARAAMYARGETSSARHNANFGADVDQGGRSGKGGGGSPDHPGLKSGWIGNMTKQLKKQSDILHHVRRQWKLMTGAVIGSFYSIAKLSPLFASYISEFGGVLGYVYDTAIIPWTDQIEALLDKLWEWGDWFDKAPEWVQKWVGALIIGVPILTGVAVAIASFGALLFWLMNSGFVIWVGGLAKGLLAILSGVSLVTVGWIALIAVVAYLLIKYTDLDDKIIAGIKNWISGFAEFLVNIKRIFTALITIIRGKYQEWYTENEETINKVKDKFNELKDKVTGIFDTIKQKAKDMLPDWLVAILSEGYGHIGANVTGSIANYLENEASKYDGSFATGATIVQDGLYKLHQGEKVVPATQASSSNGGGDMYVNINPVITVEGGISNNIDIRDMADKLARFWQDDIRRLAGGSLR